MLLLAERFFETRSDSVTADDIFTPGLSLFSFFKRRRDANNNVDSLRKSKITRLDAYPKHNLKQCVDGRSSVTTASSEKSESNADDNDRVTSGASDSAPPQCPKSITFQIRPGFVQENDDGSCDRSYLKPMKINNRHTDSESDSVHKSKSNTQIDNVSVYGREVYPSRLFSDSVARTVFRFTHTFKADD